MSAILYSSPRPGGLSFMKVDCCVAQAAWILPEKPLQSLQGATCCASSVIIRMHFVPGLQAAESHDE